MAPPLPSRAPAAPATQHAPGEPIVFQIPLLWVVAGGVLVVGVAIGSYWMGTRSNGAPRPEPAVVSPGPEDGGQPPAPQPPAPIPDNGRVSGPVSSDNTGDPRVKGYKYFVLAHPSTERAPGMVEFCRANGLDAYLVPDDNAMLRKIIVLPGYRDSAEKASDKIRGLEAAIRRVGEKWKNAARGNKDFSDAYPELFR